VAERQLKHRLTLYSIDRACREVATRAPGSNPRVAPPAPGCRLIKDFGDRCEERGTDHDRNSDLGRDEDYVEPLLGRGSAQHSVLHSSSPTPPPTSLPAPRDNGVTPPRHSQNLRRQNPMRVAAVAISFVFAHASDLLSHSQAAPGRWPRAQRRRHGSQEAHLFGVQMGMAWTRRPCVGHFRDLAVLRIDQLSAACSRQGPPRLPA
jgi:hypothetical protein